VRDTPGASLRRHPRLRHVQDGRSLARVEQRWDGVLADQRSQLGGRPLGKWVVEEIDAKLRRRGLNHTTLSENDAWAEVLLYAMGSDIERIVDAVRNPSAEAADTLRAATNDSSVGILRQIRALVEGV